MGYGPEEGLEEGDGHWLKYHFLTQYVVFLGNGRLGKKEGLGKATAVAVASETINE